MRTLVIVSFVLTTALSYALTDLVRRAALRWRLLDRNHEGRATVAYRAVPRVGGLAIALSFAVATLAVALSSSAVAISHVAADPFVWAVAAGVLAIGVVDDVRSVPAAGKLCALVATGAIMATHGHRIDHLPGLARPLGAGSATILTIAWYAGVGTAWNFIDGLDGLAAGLSALAALAYWIMSWPADPIVPVLLAAAVIGFLAHNRHPSVIFMGDGGSFFVGFWVATLGLTTANGGASMRGSFVVIGALAWPLADLAWAFVARLRRNALFRAGADHLHYVLHRRIGHAPAVQLILLVAGTAATIAIALECDGGAAFDMLLCLGAVWIFAGRVRVARPAAIAVMYVLWIARGALPSGDGLRRSERPQISLASLGTLEADRQGDG